MGLFDAIRTYLSRDGAWEDVCDRCAMCCYERLAYDDGETEIDLSAPCEFLDAESGECAVYEKRFEVCAECNKVTLRDALSKYRMPPGCAYRRLAGR